MENTKQEQQYSFLNILKIIYRRIFVLIIAVVLGVLAGVGLILAKDKPVYTARQTVMFVANFTTNSSVAQDIEVAQTYLMPATTHIKTPTFVNAANAIYDKADEYGIISEKSIGISYASETKSLIFTMSYRDATMEGAKSKLNAIIESANDNLGGLIEIMASEPKLLPVQNDSNIAVSNSRVKFMALGVGLGLVLGLVIIFALHFMDTSIKDKDELEKITGANFLTYIEYHPDEK